MPRWSSVSSISSSKPSNRYGLEYSSGREVYRYFIVNIETNGLQKNFSNRDLFFELSVKDFTYYKSETQKKSGNFNPFALRVNSALNEEVTIDFWKDREPKLENHIGIFSFVTTSFGISAPIISSFHDNHDDNKKYEIKICFHGWIQIYH